MAGNWFYSETLGLQETTTAVGLTCGSGVVAHTATHNVDAGNWLIIWACDLGHAGTEFSSESVRANFCVDGANGQNYRIVLRSGGGRRQMMAFRFMALAAGNHTISVRYGRFGGTGLLGARIQNIRQYAVKMNAVANAENHSIEDLTSTAILPNGFVDVASLTFTPARNNDVWVLLANCSVGGSVDATFDHSRVRLLLDGVAVTNREARVMLVADPGERHCYWAVVTRQLPNASHTVKIQVQADSNTTVAFRRILAFNLSRWPAQPIQESEGEETFNTTTLTPKTNPLNYAPVRKRDHAWICGWLTNFRSDTLQGQNHSFVGAPTSNSNQIRSDIASSFSATNLDEYVCQGLLHVLPASGIAIGTSPGPMQDAVLSSVTPFDIRTKGYSGFVLERPITGGGGMLRNNIGDGFDEVR